MKAFSRKAKRKASNGFRCSLLPILTSGFDGSPVFHPHLKIDLALPVFMELGRQDLAARALCLVWHSGVVTAIVGILLVYN